MTLTRAAFAVMVKFQGLTQMLQDLQADASAMLDFIAESGEERKESLASLVEDCFNSPELISCWSNATKMRRWLMHKK